MVTAKLVCHYKVCLPCLTVKLYIQYLSHHITKLHLNYMSILGLLKIIFISSLGNQLLLCNSFLKILASIGSIGSLLFYMVYMLRQTMEDGKEGRNYKQVAVDWPRYLCSFVRLFHCIISSSFAYALPVAYAIIKVLEWNLQPS